MESGKWTESKRKDKLMEHKQKIHGCAKKSQLLPCPQQHASGKQTVWFCSETALNAHLSVEHGYNAVGKQCGTINSGQVGHVNG
jgi:hypothetical protein